MGAARSWLVPNKVTAIDVAITIGIAIAEIVFSISKWLVVVTAGVLQKVTAIDITVFIEIGIPDIVFSMSERLVVADGALQKVCAVNIAISIAIAIPESEGGGRLRIDSRHQDQSRQKCYQKTVTNRLVSEHFEPPFLSFDQYTAGRLR